MKAKRSNPLFARFFRSNSLTTAVVVSLTGFALQPSARAANLYWDTNGADAGSGNADGTWDSGTNWTSDASGASTTSAWADGEIAVFAAGTDGVGAYTVTIAGTVATPSIQVEEAGGKTIAGGTINIGGGSINTAVAGNGNLFTISSIIAGSGGLTIAANGDTSQSGGGVGGALLLSGANTISGDITITSGVVRSNSGLGGSGNKVILSGGGIVDIGANTNFANNIEVPAGQTGVYRTYGGVTTAQISGTITGSGDFMRTDGGTLTINGDGSAFTGKLINARGTLILGATSTNWSNADVLQTDGGNVLRLGAAGDTTIKSLTSDRDLVIPFGSRLNILSGTYTTIGAGVDNNGWWAQGTTAGNPAATGSITSSSGSLTLTNGAATGNLTTTDNQLRLKIVDFDGSTPLAFTKNHNNSLGLDLPSTHTGGSTINGGRINAGNAAAFGTGLVTINSGGQAYLTAGGATFPNNFEIKGLGVTEDAGNLGAIRFQNNTISGSINVASAARVGAYGGAGTHSGALTGSEALEINGPDANFTGTINFTGVTSAYTGTMTLTQGTLNVGASGLGGSLVVSGGIATAVDATVTRAGGSATVAGAIAGNVTVNGGVASADGATAIATANGGVLTADGAIDGNVTVNGGSATSLNGGTATATGGTAILNSTVAGNVTVGDGGTVGGEGMVSGNFTLGDTVGSGLRVKASTAGALTVGGLTLAGSNSVVIETLPSIAGPFTILDYTTLTAGDETYFVVPSGQYRGNPQVQHDVTNTRFTLELDSQVRTWNNAGLTGNWNTADENWVEDDKLFFNGDAVKFGDTAAGTVNLGTDLQPISISMLNTAGNDYTFAGGSISGSASLTMAGGGKLTLGGANTYSGAVTVNVGILTLASQQALGQNSGVTVAAGAQVDLGGQSAGALATGGYSWTIAGDGGDGAGGLGALTNSGGDVYASSGIKSLTLSGNAEIGGNNGRFDVGRHEGTGTYGTINGGGFTLSKVGSNSMVFRAPASDITYVLNAGALTFEDYDSASGTNLITVNAGTLGTYNNRTIANDVNFTAAGATLVSQAATGIWTGAITLGGDTTFQADGNLAIDGSLAGTANITKTGGGILALQNTGASFTGKIAVNAGTLRVENNAALGSATGSDVITLAAGTGLQSGTITGFASATVGSATQGIVHLGGANYEAGAGNTLTIAGDISGPGSLTANAGTVSIGAGLALTDAVNGIVRTQNGNTLSFGPAANASSRRLQMGTGTVLIASGAQVTVNEQLITSDGGGNVSVVDQTGGTFNVTGTNNSNSTGASFLMGHWGYGSSSVYNLSGGTLNAAGAELSLGWDSNNVNFNQSGGTANFLGIDLANGRNNAAAYTMTGGRLNLGASGITNNAAKSVNLGGGSVGAFSNWASAKSITLTGTGGDVSFDTLDSVDGTSARTINLTGVLSGTGGLVKKGAGNLALSNAAGTFSGTASVEGGSLFVNSGAAAAATVKSMPGGTVQPGAISVAGAGNVANLDLAGGGATFRVGSVTDTFNVSGVFSVTGASTVRVVPGSAITGALPQSFTLIDYTGTIGGLGFAGMNYVSSNPHLTSNLVHDEANTLVQVQITAADTVTWQGDLSNDWDVDSTLNWRLDSSAGVTPSKFYDFDVVTFNDAGIAQPTVDLVGTITPAAVSVSNTAGTYTFQGSGIGGTASLVKSGEGGLTLLNNNTYVGTTTISGGTVTVGAGGTTGTLGGTGNIALNGGTLIFNRSDAQTLTRSVVGTGSMQKLGAGNLTFTGAPANLGGTFIIEDGVATLSTTNYALFQANGGIFVNDGGIMRIVSTNVFNGGTTAITVNAGGLIELQTGPAGHNHFKVLNLNGGTVVGIGEGMYANEYSTLDSTVNVGGAQMSSVTATGSGTYALNGATFNVGDSAVGTDLLFSAPLTGGILTKTGVGTMTLTGNNSYTGGTAVNGGIVEAAAVADAGGVASIGTGYLAIANDGVFRYTGNTAETTTRLLWMDQGTQVRTIEVVDAAGELNFSSTDGTINKPFRKTGPGALTIVDAIEAGAAVTLDAGRLTMSGTNTYTGATTVNGGVLVVDGDTIDNAASLVIDGTGKVEVISDETVNALFFGAAQQVAGTYGSPTSAATFKSTRFTGSAIVTVLSDPPAGFAGWISDPAFGLAVADQDPTDDPDNDGLDNAVEWVLGGNPATGMDADKLPKVATIGGNMTFTFKRDQDSKVTGTSVVIQTGTDLGAWPTSFTVGNDTAGSSLGVTVTDNLDGTDTVVLTVAQAPDARKFARLSVTID